MINLNRFQRLAYDNPVIDGQPPTHMPDGWLIHSETIDEQSVTVGVTLDVDAENRAQHGTDAVWEVSISIWPSAVKERLSHPDGLSIEVSKWTERHREIAMKAHEMNVRGISVRDDSPDPELRGTVGEGAYALHLRVPLSEEERAGLPVERK